MAGPLTRTTKALKSRRDTWAPAYAAVGVGLTAEFSMLFDTSPVVATAAVTGLAVGSWIKAKIGDPLDRAYRYAVLGASTSYVLLMHEMDHPWWQIPALAGGATVLGIPWWRDRRKTAQVRLEGDVSRWPEAARRIGMGDVQFVGITLDPAGNHKGRIVWPAGAHMVRSVLNRREELEGALDLPSGSLRLERDGRKTNSVRFQSIITDPHEQAIPWEIPTEEIDGELYAREISVLDPIALGPREDGTVKTLSMFVREWGARQLLIAGTKGGGKSSLVNLLVATYAFAVDAVQWGIDLKGGMELGPWAPVFDWMVTSYEDALKMIVALEAVVEARAAYCAARGWRYWQPDRDHPVLAVTVDECHSLNGAMKPKDLERLERISNKSRAVGIEYRNATQYPTLDAIGSTQIRENADQRFCFRMTNPDGEDFVFSGKSSVDAHLIQASRPGTCYQMDSEKLDLMPIRIMWISNGMVEQVVSLREGDTTPLDEISGSAALAAVPEYGTRLAAIPAQRDSEDETPAEVGTDEVDDWNIGPEVPIDAIMRARKSLMTEEEVERESRLDREEREEESRLQREEESRPKLSETEAHAALARALREAGPDGLKPRELQHAANRGSTWLYDTGIPRLREESKVVCTQRGTWAWADSLTNSSVE